MLARNGVNERTGGTASIDQRSGTLLFLANASCNKFSSGGSTKTTPKGSTTGPEAPAASTRGSKQICGCYISCSSCLFLVSSQSASMLLLPARRIIIIWDERYRLDPCTFNPLFDLCSPSLLHCCLHFGLPSSLLQIEKIQCKLRD